MSLVRFFPFMSLVYFLPPQFPQASEACLSALPSEVALLQCPRAHTNRVSTYIFSPFHHAPRSVTIFAHYKLETCFVLCCSAVRPCRLQTTDTFFFFFIIAAAVALSLSLSLSLSLINTFSALSAAAAASASASALTSREDDDDDHAHSSGGQKESAAGLTGKFKFRSGFYKRCPKRQLKVTL
jgi:hypothetical protein